jgi:hypothetical protein
VQALLPFVGTSHPAPRTSHDLQFVPHPRARRYVIRVDERGAVRVTIPRWGSRREAEAFAAAEQAWIEQQQRRREVERRRQPREPPLAPEVERALRARAGRELPARLLQLAAVHGLTVALGLVLACRAHLSELAADPHAGGRP